MYKYNIHNNNNLNSMFRERITVNGNYILDLSTLVFSGVYTIFGISHEQK